MTTVQIVHVTNPSVQMDLLIFKRNFHWWGTQNAINANKYEKASHVHMHWLIWLVFLLEKSIRTGVTSLKMTGVRIVSLASQTSGESETALRIALSLLETNLWMFKVKSHLLEQPLQPPCLDRSYGRPDTCVGSWQVDLASVGSTIATLSIIPSAKAPTISQGSDNVR